jgi:hypothetical protein
MILAYSAAIGMLSLVPRGAFSRTLTFRDVLAACAWAIGALVFMPLWLFIRGKTEERTLTVSPEGLSTEIGSLKGQIPWREVKLIAEASQHVLITSSVGNTFFIPARAFQGPEQKVQFTKQINNWRTFK